LTWTVAALLLLVVAFWQHQIGIDVATTWNTLPTLSRTGWWSEFATANYLKLQPPLWTWWLLTFPSYAWQQVYAAGIGLIVYAVFVRERGRGQALWMLACPLVQIMTTQPSNDWWAVGWLCLSVTWRRRWWLSALCILCAASLKYTVYAILPFLAWSLPIPTLCAGVGIAGYWGVALRLNAFWPHEQARYLLHAFTGGGISYYRVRAGSSFGHYRGGLFRRLANGASWRWHTLGRPFVTGVWWYLFPWYCQRLAIPVMAALLAVFIGYGNLKYLSLLLPLIAATHKKVKNFP
jgi:hypothetical protein